MSKTKFAVVVESREVRSGYNNVLMTKAGDKFLVTVEPEGWVEATSSHWNGGLANAKLFDCQTKAEEFAKRWKGHPWWCQPNGNFEVFEVRPIFKQVLVGYEAAHGIKEKE